MRLNSAPETIGQDHQRRRVLSHFHAISTELFTVLIELSYRHFRF